MELHFDSAGDGSPLVLLHGFGATLFTWRFLVAPLAASHRVIRVDLLGFGASPKPRDVDYSIRTQSELVEHFLAARGCRNVTLIGHSFGAAVALFTALRLKDAGPIRSLVLIDSPAYRQPLPLFIRALRTPLGPALTRIVPAEIQVRAVLKLAYFDNARCAERIRTRLRARAPIARCPQYTRPDSARADASGHRNTQPRISADAFADTLSVGRARRHRAALDRRTTRARTASCIVDSRRTRWAPAT